MQWGMFISLYHYPHFLASSMISDIVLAFYCFGRVLCQKLRLERAFLAGKYQHGLVTELLDQC